MTKVKTKKSVKARFKVTGTGKLMQGHPGKRHILSKKSSKRKRQLKKQSVVNKAQSKTYARLMGVA
ncbi:MAG: 50S ribosomal protein L35 [Chlamydiota bacterium]